VSRYFRVVNFEKHQHYKHRRPAWIKLHGSVLCDFEFGKLPDEAKAHVILIWVLASKVDNRIPFDPQWVGNQIQAKGNVDLQLLLSAGFIKLCRGGASAVPPDVGLQSKSKRQSRDRVETESIAKAMPDEPARVEPPTGTAALQAVMGAIQEHLCLGKRPDSRDAGLAKTLLRRHPSDDVLRAVEGLRLLVDRGKLPPCVRGQPVTLTYLESNKWGINVFSAALDAYYAPERGLPEKRERTGPTSLEDLAWAGVQKIKEA